MNVIACFVFCTAEAPPSPDATNETVTDSNYSSPGQHPKNTIKDEFEPDMDNASPGVTQKASGAMDVRLCVRHAYVQWLIAVCSSPVRSCIGTQDVYVNGCTENKNRVGLIRLSSLVITNIHAGVYEYRYASRTHNLPGIYFAPASEHAVSSQSCHQAPIRF